MGFPQNSANASLSCSLTGLRKVDSIYGVSDILSVYADGECCNIHRVVEDVVGERSAWIPGFPATVPAIRDRSGVNDPFLCAAGPKVVTKDIGFAVAALTMSVPGFAYLHQGGLPDVRKYETGAVVGVRAFGRGFCYLNLFREKLRYRVARILGPVPRLVDVCVLYRLGGLAKLSVQFRGVAPGIVHCEGGGIFRGGRDVVIEMCGLLHLDGDVRVGLGSEGSGVEVNSDRAVPHKVCCGVCGFFVNPVAHEERCRVARVKDPVKELIGDALHSLDVKMAVVTSQPRGTEYSELVKVYVAAVAQRSYLERLEPLACPAGSSHHSWGNAFERRYHGAFRSDYLAWLSEELGPFCCDPRVCWGEEFIAKESLEVGYVVSGWFVTTVVLVLVVGLLFFF